MILKEAYGICEDMYVCMMWSCMQQSVLKSFSAHEIAVQRGKGGGSGNSKTEIFEVYKV